MGSEKKKSLLSVAHGFYFVILCQVNVISVVAKMCIPCNWQGILPVEVKYVGHVSSAFTYVTSRISHASFYTVFATCLFTRTTSVSLILNKTKKR